jgi:hypothetical protein
MGSQLGWMQISKALGARRAGGRSSCWSDDERPTRTSHRATGATGEVLRRVLRPGRALMLIALVAVTVVSWVA